MNHVTTSAGSITSTMPRTQPFGTIRVTLPAKFAFPTLFPDPPNGPAGPGKCPATDLSEADG